MARKNYIHFRVDSETLARLDEVVASTPSGNRSEVVRSMILDVLGNDARTAAAVQASYQYSSIQKRVFKRLGAEMYALLPGIVDEVLADNAAE